MGIASGQRDGCLELEEEMKCTEPVKEKKKKKRGRYEEWGRKTGLSRILAFCVGVL